MALASQSARSKEVGRTKMNFQSPRRRKKQRMTLAIIALIVVAAGGYAAYRQWGGGKSPAQPDQRNQAANTPPTPTDTGAATPPAKTNIPVPVKEEAGTPAEKPNVLTMGEPKIPDPAPPAAKTEPVVDPLAKREDLPKGDGTPTGAAPAPAPAPAPALVDDMPADAAAAIDRAQRAMGEKKFVEARTLLNGVLANQRVKETEKGAIRSWLGEINQQLLFSPTVTPNDPLTQSYKVVSGDVLERIARNRGLAVDWRFLARVNRMSNPNALRLGQSLKLVQGPFHAVVHKSAYRLDLYAGTPLAPGSAGTPRADGSDEGWTFIRSFPVGLGENNGTPLGTFVVKKNSKLVNPHWVNPRTGERFEANDPKNPIGEHWLGLTGVDEKTKSIAGYGLHGTIDPASIGQEKSMGCVRMHADDIAVVWELLMDEVSTVRIVE